MSESQEYLSRLRDMLEAADQISNFTNGMDASAFAADTRTVWAVIRGIEIIGEAAKKVPPSIQQRYTALAWRRMAGMRDRLTHDYGRVNSQVVWQTVQEDLPDLRSRLRLIIAELEQE